MNQELRQWRCRRFGGLRFTPGAVLPALLGLALLGLETARILGLIGHLAGMLHLLAGSFCGTALGGGLRTLGLLGGTGGGHWRLGLWNMGRLRSSFLGLFGMGGLALSLPSQCLGRSLLTLLVGQHNLLADEF